MKYNAIDLFIFIARRWWKMLIALAVFAGLGVGLAYILPKKYKAVISLLPTTQDSGIMGVLSGLQSQLGISGLSIPGGDGGLVMAYGEILRSQTIKDYVIESCSLLQRMDVEDREEARAELEAMTVFKLLQPEFIFVIEVIGKDNVLVADIANAYAAGLDHYLTTSSTTRGRHLREFIETRLDQVKVDMDAAQDSLTAFQKKHKLPPINPQTGGAESQAYAELSAMAMQKELEMDYMRAFSTTDNPQYTTTRREWALLQAKLATIPPVASRYVELYRDYVVQQEIYALLIQQYEQAKLMEAKDTPLISVLEWVEPPPADKPYSPQKKLVVLVALIIGVVLIFAFCMIRVYWEHVLSHPSEHAKITQLREELKSSSGGKRKRKR